MHFNFIDAMNIQTLLKIKVKEGFQALFETELPTVEFQATRKDFEGDITVVVFPMLRYKKGNPVQIGESLGNYLVDNVDDIKDFNVVKGFLNLVVSDSFYINFFNTINQDETYGFVTETKDAMMVEYSSPNTNKPLHLGHIRNNLLGYSVAEILKASGKKVYKTQIINDRGIHICKSMLAWKHFAPLGSDGKKETPKTTLNPELKKGDKLVGNYYVKFDAEYKKEFKNIINNIAITVLNYFDSIKIGNTIDMNSINDENYKNYFTVIKKSFIEYANYKNESLNLTFSSDGNFDIVFHNNIDKIVGNDKAKIILDLRNNFFINYGEWMNMPSFNIQKDNDSKEKYYSEKNVEKVKAFVEKNSSPLVSILQEAQDMLRKWESGDEETVNLWKTMNGWVYDGFDITYKNLGVDFDTLYYESDTYLLGKDVIAEGIIKGVFLKKDDGSVWCDLTDEGLDEKLVLRSDGTAVYMTQDIGTAIQRVKDHSDINGMVYTVGNEQDYHFKVLFLILKKLGFSWSEQLYHLSYGMVDLPSGKMKSREGTVVDADDLMVEMAKTAGEISQELGKLEGYSDDEKNELYKMIGLGALKYFILKVDPKKRILFDPQASVDFQGNTGPFVQYTYARIQSILRKASFDYSKEISGIDLHDKEKELIKQLELYPEVIQQAAANYSPALIANYTYDLVKEFNSFYQNVSILGEENEDQKIFRVQLSQKVANIIKSAFSLLGIQVPNRM